MTNEEAKAFLDNLKICINEHPVVADWLVEIADRKTEPTSSKMEQVEDETRLTAKCLNCANGGSYKCSKCDGEMYYKYDKDEPQTDTEIAKAIVHKMIDDAVIAEDAYPDLRQKMHDAVDEYEPQTIRCPKCGRSDYIREFGKDFSVTAEKAGFKYKCINCNTYIEPQTERSER